MGTGRRWMLLAWPFLMAAGCGTPTATLDLIAVARRGLSEAKSAELQRRQESRRAIEARLDMLDDAFDEDVRLVSAGQVTTEDGGGTVELSADWVISARKGLSAGHRMLLEQALVDQAAHLQRLDNLAAADESLEMAAGLIVRQAAISERARQVLTKLHRRIVDED